MRTEIRVRTFDENDRLVHEVVKVEDDFQEGESVKIEMDSNGPIIRPKKPRA